jgi:hypothetical protein
LTVTDEPLRAFITRRRRELQNQLTAARGTVAAIEIQLTELDRAEQALPPAAPPPNLFNIPPPNALDNIPPAISNAAALLASSGLTEPLMPIPGGYENMTIKQLVVKALHDNHPNGLTTTELREFIRDAYSREIESNSLRPQLARLATEGMILRDPNTEFWTLPKPRTRLKDM